MKRLSLFLCSGELAVFLLFLGTLQVIPCRGSNLPFHYRWYDKRGNRKYYKRSRKKGKPNISKALLIKLLSAPGKYSGRLFSDVRLRKQFRISICRLVTGFASSALAAAVADHFHAAGLSAVSEIGFIQLIFHQRITPVIGKFELDRFALEAES